MNGDGEVLVFATPFSADTLKGQLTEYTAALSLMTKVEVQANALSTLLRENFTEHVNNFETLW